METISRLKMNTKEQINIILDNFTKMLFRRGLIDNQKTTLNKLLNIEDNNKEIYTWDDFFCVIIFQKINGIKKGSDIEEQLVKSKEKYKFVIVSESTNKTYSQIKDFNAELFTVVEFLSDIPSNPLVPLHILMSEEDKTKVLQVYKEKNIAKILNDDMMVRYIGAKKGDLIKIIRPTFNTGESVYYRRVI